MSVAANPSTAAVPAPALAVKVNTVFKRLMASSPNGEKPNELVALVAYGLYKKRKYDWCVEVAETHKRPATAAEIEMFVLQFNENQLDELRAEATRMLVYFSDAMSEEACEVAKKEGETTELIRIVERQNSWKMQVWLNVVASLFFSIFVFLVVAVVAAVNPESRLNQFFNVVFDPRSPDKLTPAEAELPAASLPGKAAPPQ